MTCEERSGFLFAHACDRPAAWPCVQCGKSICFEHTRMSAAGNTCISCARTAGQGQEYAEGDDPYFYGSAATYDADDYAAFDASADAEDDSGSGADFSGS